jgi:hypothetical protein
MFREYADARLHVYELLADMKAAEAQLAQAQQLQKEIWSHARISSSSDMTHDSVQLLPAVNEMIDVTTARTVALHLHLPWPIFSLLVIVALLSSLLAGYAMAQGNIAAGCKCCSTQWPFPQLFPAHNFANWRK